jgi:uncharacterized protein (TIGR02466 family)
VNQLFYDWQMERDGFVHIERTAAFARLRGVVQRMGDLLLRQIGVPEAEVRERDRRSIHAWATVHQRCVSHLLHTHPGHLLSGVYYVRMPERAGHIVFHDPRGPRFPFDQREQVQPRPGDLILFPSWLAHTVTPTGGESERISIAFNLVGSWDQTVGVRADLPLATPV